MSFFPPCVPRISVKFVFFFIIILLLTDAFTVETIFFHAWLKTVRDCFRAQTSKTVIVYDSGGWVRCWRRGVCRWGRWVDRPLWSLWSPCCGFSTFGSQTSVLCTRALWCGVVMMSKRTYDGVGMCVVERALLDKWPWGNWEAGFMREFGIYITQHFTGQTFPSV